MTRTRRMLGALLGALLVAPAARAGEAPNGHILVFAAASLAEAFAALGAAFEGAHPGLRLEQNVAGSPALVAQIEAGAPADLVATADTESLTRLERAGMLAEAPVAFARNRLAIVVERGNLKGVRELADLARPDLVVILPANSVPAGRYAREILARAGVTVEPRSLEQNVKAVVNKVSLGEADAGIVYVTDVRAAGERVTGVPIAERDNAVATYPIALLARSASPEGALAFRAFVLSEAGQTILAGFGFLPP